MRNVLLLTPGLLHHKQSNVYIWWPTLDPGIKKIFSVPRTESCVNGVFSFVTCIYCRFESQAPERVLLWYVVEYLCGMLYAVHTICDLCDLLCLNEMSTKLYGSWYFCTAYWDSYRHCEIIYNTQSGSKTMRVKSSLLHWGCVTINTVPNMFEVIHKGCKFST